MLYRVAKILLLSATLGGLCLPLLANTTSPANVTPQTAGSTTESNPSVEIGQTDLAAPPVKESLQQPGQQFMPSGPAAFHISLLLPLRSETLQQFADAVREGFLSAYKHDPADISVEVIETDDTSADILSAYTAALSRSDMVVGPLSRNGVTELAQSDLVNKPTLALTQPDVSSDARFTMPQKMLVIGLSIEDEAKQVARWATAEKKAGKAFIISTSSAWQHRAATAFAVQWQAQGKEMTVIELSAGGGYLTAKALADLRAQIQTEQPGLLFAALDARQARQVRSIIGADIPLYGTSQLNPWAWQEWSSVERNSELDGVRFVDMPWQLTPDDPAVMVYPRFPPNPAQKRSADLERLYALGIDAYRIAREIRAPQATSFELDGVTGLLTVRFGQGPASFARVLPKATYRQGSVSAVVAPR